MGFLLPPSSLHDDDDDDDGDDDASVCFRECPQATFEVYVEVGRLGPQGSGECQVRGQGSGVSRKPPLTALCVLAGPEVLRRFPEDYAEQVCEQSAAANRKRHTDVQIKAKHVTTETDEYG